MAQIFYESVFVILDQKMSRVLKIESLNCFTFFLKNFKLKKKNVAKDGQF